MSVFCPCGNEILKDQHCIETPRQFEKRLASGFCRSKCSRIYAPVKAERGKPTLELVSFGYHRPELVAQVKILTPRDPAFLDFVRTFDCIGCKWPAHLKLIEAHHIYTGGTSIKCSDYDTVPLCGADARGCHAAADKDEKSGEKFKPFALYLVTMWIQAGHKLKKGGDDGGTSHPKHKGRSGLLLNV